jgi:hypothetical protein
MKQFDASKLEHIDPNSRAAKAKVVREALVSVSSHLEAVDNQSGARAAFVLSTVNDDDALLFLGRLLKG